MAYPVNTPSNEIVVDARLADISTESSAYAVAVRKGAIVRAYSALQGSISGADAVWTLKINGAAVNGASVTVPHDGSAAGQINGVNPINSYTSSYVNEGDTIEFASNGASSTTCPAHFCAVIRF